VGIGSHTTSIRSTQSGPSGRKWPVVEDCTDQFQTTAAMRDAHWRRFADWSVAPQQVQGHGLTRESQADETNWIPEGSSLII
jgi:hypothetical protein